MHVIVAEDSAEQCRAAADIFERIIREKPDCTLGLATGSSPLGLYRELARRCTEEGLDFSRVHSVNLDEYVGLAPTHPQSYRSFMDANLFDHVNIDKANTFVARGDGDAAESLAEFRAVLAQRARDVQLLGVGRNGHLGFNEPAEQLAAFAHEEVLKESTRSANARFFESMDEVPRRALTMGMADILQAKKLVLIISEGKEDAARRLLLEETVTTACPVTMLRLHPDAVVLLQKKLADAIGYRG
ncbi:MAG: glucosamine-6-phosphate deaminase [Ruminococcaceae bacterium]|nr:glucosamine-6-phosphate deaminase [Oscillospiraceae bacterium]